jgi:hypothetical protein
MRSQTVFNKHVPKTVRENLLWRKRLFSAVKADSKRAAIIKEACRRDPIFFIDAFCYTVDPRSKTSRKVPFILWKYQEMALWDIVDAMGDHDLLIEKSRDMGASWLCLAAITWAWLFHPDIYALLVSSKEEMIDAPGNPKTLFWKIDYLLHSLPSWLMPRGFNSTCRIRNHLENPENGSVVDGEATVDNVARGDRRTVILFDEFAAVPNGHRMASASRDASDCRIFNSTPNGTNNAFYDLRKQPIKRLRLHWSDHPKKRLGLYTTDSCRLHAIDAKNYPSNYKPVLDGKLRSPWYDLQCERAASPREIAQELDIDYLGSGFQYFNAAVIQSIISRYAREPDIVGNLEYDAMLGEPIRFVPNSQGLMRLWICLNAENKPSCDYKIYAGVDVSAGVGASNSCISGYNKVTKVKVFEYANPYLRPEEFAACAVAIGRFFFNAKFIWEHFGPGRQFGSRLLELGYYNFYYRKREEKISKTVTDVPGWAPTPEKRALLLGAYRAALESGECVNYSALSLGECLEYSFGPDGRIIHSASKVRDDPTGAVANHGDRCFADALAWKLVSDEKRGAIRDAPMKEIPIGCLAWRNQQRYRAKVLSERDGW